MNASELNRKLLFCGYNDLTDYLRNSPLNRYIYKVLLSFTQKWHIEVPIEKLLNEIYYQSIRVRFDTKPGYEINKRYVEESKKWLDSKVAAELVFSIVWVLFHRRRKLSFVEECFFEQLRLIVKEFDPDNFQEELLEDMKTKEIIVPDEFQPLPCPVDDIPVYYVRNGDNLPFFPKLWDRLFMTYYPKRITGENMWRIVTDNFSHAAIEKYVNIYKKLEDQVALLERIKHACPQHDMRIHEDFFYMLGISISSEQQGLGKSICFQKTVEDGDGVHEGPVQFVGPAAQEYLDYYSRELTLVAEQYKQERNALKEQLEQQKKNYETDLESIEAKYQTEIAALKKDLDKMAAENPKGKSGNDAAPEELYMTVNEIVSDAKEWFHESGASELTNMLYRYIKRHKYHDKNELWDQIESIIPAVEKRTTPLQKVDVSKAGQVNIGSQTVDNHWNENKE